MRADMMLYLKWQREKPHNVAWSTYCYDPWNVMMDTPCPPDGITRRADGARGSDTLAFTYLVGR